MKFCDLKAFEAHLKSAYPQGLSPVYILIIPSDEERQAIANYVVKILLKANGNLRLVKTEDPEIAQNELNCFSLLGDYPVIYLDKIKKTFTPSVPRGAFLILGMPKAIAKLPEGVTLDLSKEKPWDKDKRIKDQIVAKAQAAGKPIEHAALEYLFGAIGPDQALLERELEKLICFAHDKMAIDLSSVQSLVMPSAQQSMWQIAEQLVWERRLPKRVVSNDFPVLVGSIRYQLELGLALCTLTPEQFQEHYPKLRPRAVDKCRNCHLPRSYFENGLRALYKAERLFKDGISNGGLCLDLFVGQLCST